MAERDQAHEAELAALRDKHAGELGQAIEQRDQALAAARAEHERETEGLKAAHAARLSEQEQQYQAELQQANEASAAERSG